MAHQSEAANNTALQQEDLFEPAAPTQTEGSHERHIELDSDQPQQDAQRKDPPTPSTEANAPHTAAAPTERGSADQGGEDELRKDPMMARLLDALAAGEDIGHYGRLIFSMVARHFLPHEEVMRYLVHDRDFSEEQAAAMLRQVDSRDYNPPRRERLVEWQREQDFQFLDPNDPDSGNLYRNLKFPNEIYQHIEHYQEAKSEAA